MTTAFVLSGGGAAIPAVFPPVTVEDRPLWDGGIADNAAISQALALGADPVFVLPAGVAWALDQPPRESWPAPSTLSAC